MTKEEREYFADLLRRLAYFAGWAVEEDGVGERTVAEAEKVAKELEDGTWTKPNV